jgi:hypothetical protein
LTIKVCIVIALGKDRAEKNGEEHRVGKYAHWPRSNFSLHPKISAGNTERAT